VPRRRAEIICIAALSLFGVYSLVLLPVAPSLLGRHPVLLELLRGSTPAMITGGAFARVGEASLLLALLAPLPTLMMADPFLWWAGRIWGPEVAHMLRRGQSRRGKRWTERGIHWAEHYGSWVVVFSYFLPVPSALVFAGAGWTGLPLRRFLFLDLIGTSLWVASNVMVGYLIGRSAVDVAKTVSRYGLYVTIAIVVGVFLVSARRAREAPA
jgi:membrane protein DedA with SNARE-associated domain